MLWGRDVCSTSTVYNGHIVSINIMSKPDFTSTLLVTSCESDTFYISLSLCSADRVDTDTMKILVMKTEQALLSSDTMYHYQCGSEMKFNTNLKSQVLNIRCEENRTSFAFN